MNQGQRKTKIICTLGPASESPEILKELILAGANIFRLNMSHATHEWVRRIVPTIRRISKELDMHTGILLDTQGPAIRTGDLPAKLDLHVGDILEFTVRGEKSEDVVSVDVNYEGLVDDISVGDTVLVDNGVIHMKVLEKLDHRIRCEVMTPGVLGSRRHINLPGVRVNLPPLTEKDLADIAVGVEQDVDFVALSFCRGAEDVAVLRRVLEEKNSKARIVSKIEDQSAVREVNGIIEASDAIMIARGDLGVECPMEELPIIQRSILKKCIRLGKPVIVATHMLESMIENPLPTRAEITDVANAVFEQADAIMLSGETTVGKYPVECVRVLDRVARRIERSGGAGYANEAVLRSNRQKTVQSAIVLANALENSCVVVFTRSGKNAWYAARLRPRVAPIYAFSPNLSTVRQLALHWGTTPILMPFEENPTDVIHDAEQVLKTRGFIKEGQPMVVVCDVYSGNSRFDAIQLRHIE